MNARLRVLAGALGLIGLALGWTGCVTTPTTSSISRADDPRLIGTWAGDGERADYRLIFQSRRFSLERGEWVQSKGSYTAEAEVLSFRATGSVAEPEVGVYRLPDPDMLIIETEATGEVVWRRQGARAPGAFPELEPPQEPRGLFDVMDEEEIEALEAERSAGVRGLGESALGATRGVVQTVAGGIKRTGQRVMEAVRSDVGTDPPDELEDVGRTIERAKVTVEETAREEWREAVTARVGVEARRDGNDGESTGEAGEAGEAGETGEAGGGGAALPGDSPPLRDPSGVGGEVGSETPRTAVRPAVGPTSSPGGVVVDAALADGAREVAREWAPDAILIKISARCGADGSVDLVRFPDGATFWFGSPTVAGGYIVSAVHDGGMVGNPLPGVAPMPPGVPEVPASFVSLPEAAAVLRAHGESDPVLPMSLEALDGADGWYWWAPKAGAVAADLVAVDAATGRAVPYDTASGRAATRDLATDLEQPRPLASSRYDAIREAADSLARRWDPEMKLFMVYLLASRDNDGTLNVQKGYFDYMGPGDGRGIRVARVVFDNDHIHTTIVDSDFVGGDRMPALPGGMLSADQAFGRLLGAAGRVDGVFGLDALSITERPVSYAGGGIVGLFYDNTDETRLAGRSVWRLNQQVRQSQVLQPNLRGGSSGGVFDRSYGKAYYVDAVTGEAL